MASNTQAMELMNDLNKETVFALSDAALTWHPLRLGSKSLCRRCWGGCHLGHRVLLLPPAA